MVKVRAVPRMIAVLVVPILLIGCQPGGLLDQLGDNLGGLEGLADKDVYQALAILVEGDTTEATETTDDEPGFFGEQAEAFTEVAPTAVELTEEEALAEAETEFGGRAADWGRLAGRYVHDIPNSTSDASGGLFRGQWFSHDDEPQGVLRGEFGPLPDGWPVGLASGGRFRGKFIDDTGQFRGLLRGFYGHTYGGRTLFFGHWIDRHNRLVGILKGHWTDEPETEGGTFAGWWVAFNICDKADTLPEFEFETADFGGFAATAEVLDATETIDPDATELADEPDLQLQRAADDFCIDPTTPHGFLRGWHAPGHSPNETEAASDGNGWLRGHWRTRNGNAVGVLLGRYEALADDDSAALAVGNRASASGETIAGRRHAHRLGVFYAKYVDEEGQFRGFIRGTYGWGTHGVAVFRGHYYNDAGEQLGILRGRWDNAPQQLGGPFLGVWAGIDPDEL
ncbi:MAG: hypothetical protein KKB50_12430 [Planctomycetes bacterium]|nr:hypothetical protein [Planctomycetota bacterium]